MSSPPNVLLITTDMQRRDTLGCYANPLIRTPHLDALAASGVRFDNAFANNPVCMPQRASLLTGKLPSAHGVRWNSGGLAAHEVTVTRRLKDAGYQTAALGKMHWGDCRADLALDHLNVTDEGGLSSPGVTSYRAALRAAGLDALPHVNTLPEYKDNYGAATSPLPLDYHLDGFIANATVDYLTHHRDPSRPFFAWCSFFGPHLPVDPAAPWDRLYDPAEMPLPVWRDDEFDAKPPEQRAFQQNTTRGNGFGDYRRITHDLARLRRFIAFYWGKISMIDHLIGRVLAALEATGQRDNTLILFTTDHGDFAGHHRLLFKSAFLYDDLVHIPLIASWPARWGAHAGAARDQFVETIDLVPTILGAAGLDPTPGIQGDDLAPVIDARAETWRDAAYSEAVDQRMLRTRDWKLVHYANRPYGELYHLAEDPHELSNRWHDPACLPIRDTLHRRLLDRTTSMEARLHPPIRWLDLPDPADPAHTVRLPFI